jgi:hypothetical protein
MSKLKSEQVSGKIKLISFKQIVSNTGQSRGMGVLSRLKAQGYGLFEQMTLGDDAKDPIWPMLVAEEPEKRKAACDLIESFEPEIVALAERLQKDGQLQPIGVMEETDGVDVIWGMRRAVAMAYNYARDATHSDQIETKVISTDLTLVERKLLAYSENDDREDESPIDRALFYKGLQDDGLKPKEIGQRVGGKSDQHVRNYIKLLDKLLDDRRWAIHTRDLAVEPALKLLEKRKNKKNETMAAADRDEEGEEEVRATSLDHSSRDRLPTAKRALKDYGATKRPKHIDKKEWDLWITDDVRKWVAFRLGLKFKPFVAKEETKPESNGQAPKKGKVFNMTKKFAAERLIEMGQTNARTYDVKTLKEKLENLPNNLEEGVKMANPKHQEFIDRMLKAYPTGLIVNIKG